MDAIKAITDHNRRNQRHHPEAPKHSQDEPLKQEKKGHGNQPQSYKAALLMNKMRAS
jgi:hypothetical protein